MRAWLALLLLSAALAGCSGSDDQGPSSQPTATVVQTKTVTTPVTHVVTATPTETQTATSTPITSSSSSSTQTQTSPPGVRPAVENVTRGTLTDTTVVLVWNITGGEDARSKVEYGPGGFSLNTALQNGTGERTVTLTALKSCTDYSARVVALGGGYSVESSAVNFRTLGSAPTVTTPVISNILHDRFTVSWSVTGPGDSVSLVEYGGTTAYGSTTASFVGAGSHSVVLSGLTKNTDYNLRVKVTAGCGTANTGNVVQKTADLVRIEFQSSSLTGYAFSPSDVTVDDLRRYVFEVKNSDTSPHVFEISGQSYTSPSIAAGATYVFPLSIQLPSGNYMMKDPTVGGGPTINNLHSN